MVIGTTRRPVAPGRRTGGRTMDRRARIAIVLALAIVGCSSRRWDEDKVTSVADDDARMNAAIAKAKATVDTFIAALKSPKPGQKDFSVKMPFVDGEHTEHMWLAPVSYDGKVFRGIVNNEPQSVKNVRLGQEVEVAPPGISDWMYVENGKIVGGRTIRVLRETLPAGERADFDQNVRFADE
jgi:uncharacterized protein YegJ (DUF2314 family)